MVGRGSSWRASPLRVWASLAAAAVLAGVLAAVGPAGAASAQQAGVVLPPQAQAECHGSVPIVVGSDAAAQSDIYSAVTLAGVIGTDCIVLAGPRGEPMAAAQRARLDVAAAGGFIVGGTDAVPEAKTAGRDMVRIAGTDRWHTARLVGDQARRSAGGAPGDTAASAGAQNPDTDCTGDVPIVVASDPAAESDRYSAVTLAGVIGTDCIVLAGPRGEPMAADQQARLAAAAAGGLIVGGTASVPPAKAAGRTMTRLAGNDRWHTAHLVGTQARHVAGGGSPAFGASYSDVFVGDPHAVSVDRLHRDGVLAGTDCDLNKFCPREAVNGRTFATWLSRVIEGRSTTDPIARLAALGVTSGCTSGPDQLCPEQPITRAQMATFLARGLKLTESYPAKFVDVDEDDPNYENINKIDFAKIDDSNVCTKSTSPRQFCPKKILLRGQAAEVLSNVSEWLEAVEVVKTTGSDNSIKLKASYDEDDLEADLSWTTPKKKVGKVDRYIVQWRMPWEGFTPLWHQVIEVPEKSRKTKFKLSIPNAEDVRNLYAVRVIAVYSNGDRLVTDEVKVPSYTHEFRNLIKERLVDTHGDEQPWLKDVWGHINSHNFALVATKRVGAQVNLGGYDNPDGVEVTTAKLFTFSGRGVPHFDGNLSTIIHELGHVYTLTDSISDDTAPVGIGRLYLNLLRLEIGDDANRPSACTTDELYADLAELVFFDVGDKFRPGYGVRGAGQARMGYWGICGFRFNTDEKYQDALVNIPQIAQRAFVDQEMPDWFYDTYQKTGGEIDLESLWSDIDTTYQGDKAIIAHSLRNEFGGYCSEADVRKFIRGEVTGITNPWRDGGCEDIVIKVVTETKPRSGTSAGNGGNGGGSIPYEGPAKVYLLSFLQEYRSRIERCWIAIGGYAYDVTPSVGYVYTGPGSIGQLCGQDASKHFNVNGLDPPPQEFIKGHVRG